MSRLVLELLADANNLIKNLDRAQASVDRFIDGSSTAGHALGSGINRGLEAFTDLAKGGAVAAGVLAGAIVASSVALTAMTVSTAAHIDELDRLSQKTGIAIQTIQQWSVVLAENDFQAESLTSGMGTLSKLITEAHDPASTAAATFESMGLSIHHLGSTESVLRGVADRFQAMPDGPEKARMAVQLFGKAGLEMIPILNKGGAAFDESRAAAERFGAVLSAQQVAALNAVDSAADRLGVALTGLKQQWAVLFAGPVAAGIESLTAGIATLTAVTTNYAEALEQVEKRHPKLAALMPGVTAAMAAVQAAQMPPPVPPAPPTGPQDAHVAEYALSVGERQEALGQRIRDGLIAKYRLLVAEQHAQEALGRVTIAMIQSETAARSEAFALQLQQQEDLNNLQFQKPPTSTAYDAQLTAVKALMELMPELTVKEASLLALHNQQAAHDTVTRSLDAYAHRNQLLDDAVTKTKVLDEAQQTLYRSEAGLFGAADAARQQRFALIDAEIARKRQAIEEEIFDETRKAEALQNLETETETRRRQAIQQFPTFFEQQMQAIVASSSFSMGQMVSTWTGGIANMVVHGGNLKAAWEQTQVALVQASLNAGVQMLAQVALAQAQEFGLLSAAEAAKLGLKTTSNAAALASDTATAGAMTAIWTGASGAIVGAYGAVAGAFAAISATLVTTITAVGTFVMGVLSAIAEALTATVFGIPYAGAILLGVAVIAAALAATGNLGFKEGGIGDFGAGTPATLHGQEAIIPLNARGAAFMRETLGVGGGEAVQQTIVLDGRVLARSVSEQLPSVLRMSGVPA